MRRGLKSCTLIRKVQFDMAKYPAVFLDRDGVLVENIDGDYIRTMEQIKVLAGVRESLQRLSEAGFVLVIVTNQAAVGKGMITMQQALRIQETIENRLDLSGNISLHSIICPHASKDDCICRKPKPGMLVEAADKYEVDLARSFLIGDARTDIAAARCVGVRPVMVLTGRGEFEYNKSTDAELEGVIIRQTIIEDVDFILNTEGEKNG